MESTPQTPSTASARPARESLSLIVLGVLLSLIIKSALDRAFETVPRYNNFIFTPGHAWSIFAAAPERRLLIFFQLLVFLFTLVRFYLGAYRFARHSTGNGIPEATATVVGTFVLFSGFYVTSLTLRSQTLFYWAVVVFHVVDFIWFFIAHTLLRVPKELGAIVGLWKVFDVTTIVGIVLSLCFLPGTGGRWASLALLLSVGALDFFMLKSFYLDEPDWKTATRFVRWKLKVE